METKQEFRKRVPGHSEATVSELDLTPYSVLLAYVPLKTEVDITPVIDLALSKGLKVAVPETPEEFVCLTPGWRNSLRTIPNGTQCPEEGEPINPVSVKPQCLMLVPGLAFTPDGRRLGRGGGFYDRVLSKLPENVRTLGICSSECLFADIPTQEHDRRVDSVLVCGKNNCMPVSTAVVLIPAYEPGEKLLPYVEELIASGFGNIVVVDDGSGPEYQKIFEGVAELPKTHVIHHEVNRGKGAALKTGCA